jgi:hypothetical protein
LLEYSTGILATKKIYCNTDIQLKKIQKKQVEKIYKIFTITRTRIKIKKINNYFICRKGLK